VTLGAVAAGVVAVALVVGALTSRGPRAPLDLEALASYPPPSGLVAGETVTLSGAGDIARCDGTDDEATAALLDELPGFVFTTGDNAYGSGSERDFAECYAPSWGRHRERTFPVLGNHDFETATAAGYFGFFGERGGDPRAGWYSVDLGDWRLLVLASNCNEVGGCGPESDQGRWLAAELDRSPETCTIALWHAPLFSTGWHGPSPSVKPLWDQLYAAGVELVVNGHEHDYERFVPLDPGGTPDVERGIRQIIVGTGGAELRQFERDDPNSEVRDASTHGVLRLELDPGRYAWSFIPVQSGGFTDSGSDTCH
jgi:acid phosphatase type 7